MASPSVSTVREKVIRERVVPPAELAKESANSMPDVFEYLEKLTPEEWNEHICYLYREDPKATQYPGAGFAYLDKYAGTIEIRPGYTVQMTDAGTIQGAIKEKFGGRVFRLIVKRGRERITEGRFMNEAPPKYPDANPQFSTGSPLPNAPQATDQSVAAKAIDAMANQQPDALRLAMDMLRNTSEVLFREKSAQVVNPAPPATSFVDQTIIQTLLAKALAPPPPPPDPFELFLKFKEIIAPPTTNSIKEVLETVTALKNSGFLGAGRGSGWLDLAREALPPIASTVSQAMHEWRLGMEAQRDGSSAMIHTAAPGGPGPIINANPQPLPPAAPPAGAPPQTATPANGAQVNGDPPFEWIEMKIAQIVKDLDLTVDEAVDEVLSFLYIAHPRMVQLLLDPPKLHEMLPPGEKGLLTLFQNREALKTVPVNPRLSEFIHKFVAAAKESESSRLMESAVPAVPVPTKPA